MTLPTEDVAALVARVANAINIARYQTPDGLPARELHEEDGRTQEYAMRLARAAVSEFDPLLSTLAGERDSAERALLTVQNAAKTIAAAHGTELEHLRQNASFDHSLRAEVESLRQHNSEMTDALTAAEARIAGLEAALDEAIEFLEFWGEYASEYFRDKHDLAGDMASLRRAREALSRQEGGR